MGKGSPSPRRRLGGWSLGLLLLAGPAAGAVCHVPGDYPSIGEAVAVAACTEVVLANGVHTENVRIGRSVGLRGAGVGATTLRGRVKVEGSAAVAVEALTIDTAGCWEVGLEVTGSASVQAAPGSFAVADGGGEAVCPLFRDGFETGTTGRWGS